MRRLGLTVIWVLGLVLAYAAGIITMALFTSSKTPTPVALVATPTLSIVPATTPPTPSPSGVVASPTLGITPTLLAQPTTTFTTSAPTSPTLELLVEINTTRAISDCPGLTWEPRLAQIAQDHADDLGKTGVIDHVSSDGSTYTQRLERVGYPFIRRGENIAAGDTNPADVLFRWMDEPPDGPHRLNILNCAYRHAGIGISEHPNGYPIWVLDLAEPRDP